MLLLLMVKQTPRECSKFSTNQRRYNEEGGKNNIGTNLITCGFGKFTKHMICIMQYLSFFYIYSWGYVCDQMR
mgnify:FL=1